MNRLFTLAFAWVLTGTKSHQLCREVDVERKLTGMGMQPLAKGGLPPTLAGGTIQQGELQTAAARCR
jgi:hypothetical protein